MTEHPNLATAMIAARLKVPVIAKTAKNPHFGNSYAPLGPVLSIVWPIYAAEGVLLTTEGEGEGWLRVVATHAKTGESKHCGVQIVGASDMQKLGGGFTYGQRYGYGALLALELDDDDDGNAASHKPAPARPQDRPSAPISRPQGSGAKPSGKASREARPVMDGDAELVWAMAEALDRKAEADGQTFRIIKDGKLGVFGKVADKVNLKPGRYTVAQIEKNGSLLALMGFYEWMCQKNGIKLPLVQYQDAREADAMVEGDEVPPMDDDSLPF